MQSTPTQVLVTTTFQPLVGQLAGSLAHGARQIDQFLHQELMPQKMAQCERDLWTLLREGGRRVMGGVLHHLEPHGPEEAPSRLWWQGTAYRRRRKHRTALATLFGPVVVWRRLYEPLPLGCRAIHPLEVRLGIAAGLATPALAERRGAWAADHSQRQGLAMLRHDHGVPGSCTTLRKLLGWLSAGMATHRHAVQVEQVVRWVHQARASTGRLQPPRAVGRAGVNGPMRHGDWKEGATATVSVMDRRGKRLGTVSLGQMPESGQTTLTAQLTALLQDIVRHVASQSLRLVSVSEDGYHPSDDYHKGLQKMHAPRRPWRQLAWRRLIDDYHACLDLTQLAEAICGAGAQGWPWAKQMRKSLQTTSDGITRVWQSASALRRQHGVWGPPKGDDHADSSLKKRTQWMRYRHDSRQRLPLGSGITEAACKIVFTQRRKRSGMSWTIAGGQVILDVRVLWLSGSWDAVHQRYLASKRIPHTQADMAKDAQREQQAT